MGNATRQHGCAGPVQFSGGLAPFAASRLPAGLAWLMHTVVPFCAVLASGWPRATVLCAVSSVLLGSFAMRVGTS